MLAVLADNQVVVAWSRDDRVRVHRFKRARFPVRHCKGSGPFQLWPAMAPSPHNQRAYALGR
jgi:hypothetical protein